MHETSNIAPIPSESRPATPKDFLLTVGEPEVCLSAAYGGGADEAVGLPPAPGAKTAPP